MKERKKHKLSFVENKVKNLQSEEDYIIRRGMTKRQERHHRLFTDDRLMTELRDSKLETGWTYLLLRCTKRRKLCQILQ